MNPSTAQLFIADPLKAFGKKGTGGMGGGDVTVVEVADVEDIASQYLFQPLPDQLFGSQPDVPSTFLFQQKSTLLWDNPPDTGPSEAANTCDACFPGM